MNIEGGMQMAGWIVGITFSSIVLLLGIYGVMNSRRKRVRNKWAWWFVLFGCCALVSAVINYQFK
ncbi:MAG: hypothetical protein IKE29_01855 [Paenibacillus sp.]|uniref:hypothetical protein n=1 Tax=Paenibacillus sp. TaxID=58172 RepID=UPI0025DF1691|nr:hypothetical protein [Paenibacillus sp.]MBR2563352.1 hypothetical protein [Paenibacillus sp.]